MPIRAVAFSSPARLPRSQHDLRDAGATRARPFVTTRHSANADTKAHLSPHGIKCKVCGSPCKVGACRNTYSGNESDLLIGQVERLVALEFVIYLNEVLIMFGLFKKQPAIIYDLPFGEKNEGEIRKLAENLSNQIRVIVHEDVSGSNCKNDGRASLLIEEAAFDISSNMFDRIKIWEGVENVDMVAYRNLIAAFQNPRRRNGLIASMI